MKLRGHAEKPEAAISASSASCKTRKTSPLSMHLHLSPFLSAAKGTVREGGQIRRAPASRTCTFRRNGENLGAGRDRWKEPEEEMIHLTRPNASQSPSLPDLRFILSLCLCPQLFSLCKRLLERKIEDRRSQAVVTGSTEATVQGDKRGEKSTSQAISGKTERAKKPPLFYFSRIWFLFQWQKERVAVCVCGYDDRIITKPAFFLPP